VSTSRSGCQNKPPNRIGPNRDEPITEIWRADGFKAIELHIGSTSFHEYPRHWHDELYFCAILVGSSDVYCVDRSYSASPETLVLIPPGEVHADRKRDCAFRCMFIDLQELRSGLEGFTEQTLLGLNFHMELIRGAKTMRSFLRAHRSLEKPESKLAADSAIMRFFHTIVMGHSTEKVRSARDGDENAAVRRTKRFLDEHYAQRTSLHELSRFTGLSPYHLHRSFCKKIGMPPHGYLTQVRINQARLLLKSGMSISDVAYSVGFWDQSHFARHFKKLSGVTPGQYVHIQRDRTRRSPSSEINWVA
jgi:AraC-like DNA-binding protein